ncbi:hypothetical protein [Methylocaldum szegediense]|jgi:hypothetical protein|uniref:hypothetical protein n=1 Tax=Methylocaldum szegediense TaxID=73780 RepID=UPI0003F90A6C|nr:hypothetical protein [Methylocaldum szegediense]
MYHNIDKPLRMELSEAQHQEIARYLPRQSGVVRLLNLQALSTILYVVEHGCA